MPLREPGEKPRLLIGFLPDGVTEIGPILVELVSQVTVAIRKDLRVFERKVERTVGDVQRHVVS